MNNIDYIGADELVFNNKSGIQSGGFSVNSIMMKNGISPIITVNDQTGGTYNKVSDLFNSLVIPSWVISYDNNSKGGYNKKMDNDLTDDIDDEDIDDDLHDKLLDLVRDHERKTIIKKKKTKKNKATNKKTYTKKHK